MWLSTTKLSKIEGVTTQTIREWAKAGKYEEYKITEGSLKQIESIASLILAMTGTVQI